MALNQSITGLAVPEQALPPHKPEGKSLEARLGQRLRRPAQPVLIPAAVVREHRPGDLHRLAGGPRHGPASGTPRSRREGIPHNEARGHTGHKEKDYRGIRWKTQPLGPRTGRPCAASSSPGRPALRAPSPSSARQTCPPLACLPPCRTRQRLAPLRALSMASNSTSPPPSRKPRRC